MGPAAYAAESMALSENARALFLVNVVAICVDVSGLQPLILFALLTQAFSTPASSSPGSDR